MAFDPSAYGPEVARLLALDGSGERLMPLVADKCSSTEAHSILSAKSAHDLFAGSTAAEGALTGLWLYFSCFDEAHSIAQDLNTKEGSYWHAILHRQEPDAGNSAYWFKQTGAHPVFPQLHKTAADLLTRYEEVAFRLADTWDPYAFIDLCEVARRNPGSHEEEFALAVQRAEWQLLFDFCARPRG